MALSWFRFSSPASFYPLAGAMIPWFAAAAALLAAIGLYIGFRVAPTDFQQGEVYRIIFIHVPAAWMSMFLYVVMAFWSAAALGFNTRLSAMMAQAIAPTGALMTFIALWSGALWGRPTWGTYWAWDARMTSELILLFLYLGVIALRQAIDDPRRADRACAVLTLVGVVNVPIIYFSVHWWNTLHQGASIKPTGVVDGSDDADRHAGDDVRVLVLRDRRRADARARDHPRARARHRVARSRWSRWARHDERLAFHRRCLSS